MSSSISIAVTVVSAVSGATMQIELPEESIGANLQDRLQRLTGIPASDHILLYGPPFAQLSSRRPLRNIGSKTVFLYNRASLHRNATPPAVPELVPDAVELPAQVSSSILEESLTTSGNPSAGNPLVAAMTHYEKSFVLGKNQGDALYNAAVERTGAIKNCVSETQMLVKALEAAHANLEDHATSIHRAFVAFQSTHTEEQQSQQALLQSFDADLAQLPLIQLHPAVATEGLQTLADCCPVEPERKWAERCRSAAASLADKIQQQTDIFQAVEQGIQQETEAASSAAEVTTNVQDAVALVADAEAQLRRQQEASAELTKHCDDFMEQAHGLVNSVDSLTTDGLTKPNEMHTRNQELIPAMMEADEFLRRIMRRARELKVEVVQHLHTRLRAISTLQYKIQKLSQTLSMLRDAAATVSADFDHLMHVKQLPHAYHACLREVVRRRKYAREFEAKAQAVAEELANMREREVELRQTFLHEHFSGLPPALVNRIGGLNERPPNFDFHARPFDLDLPDISEESLESAPAVTSGGKAEENDDTKGQVLLGPSDSADDMLQDDPLELQRRISELEAEVARLRGPTSFQGKLHALLCAPDTPVDTVRWNDDGTAFHVLDSDKFEVLLHAKQFDGTLNEIIFNLRSCGFLVRNDVWCHPCFRRDAPEHLPHIVPSGELVHTTPEFDHFKALTMRRELSEPEPSDFTRDMDAVLATAKEAELAASSLAQSVINDEQLRELRDELATAQKDATNALSRCEAANRQLGTVQERLLQAQAETRKAQADLKTYRINAAGNEQDMARLQESLVNVGEGLCTVDAELVQPKGPLPISCISLRVDEPEPLSNYVAAVEAVRDHASSVVELLGTNRGIAYRDFKMGDTVLFIQANGAHAEVQTYMAFHRDYPHNYLAHESVEAARDQSGSLPTHLLGTIIFSVTAVASAQENPFGLPIGTEYHLLTAECTEV